MNQIIKANNLEELKKMIKKNLALSKDETYEIKEIKKPFNFLFIHLKGEYEVKIVNKEKIKETKKTEVKVEKKEKEVIKAKETVKQNPAKDDKMSLVENKIKNLLDSFGLDISLESVKLKNGLYFVNLEGRDIKYIIGEKGIALNSLEYLLNSIKELKGVKIVLDANGYREKRENSLISMANKKAQKVIDSKSSVKLPSLSSRERKIIHEELSKYPELETQSHGVEPKRYLIIKYIGE
ncbi:Jag family protein [Oceanivirga miroungae]|uniref:Single-stranded nucleic acid binding R3H domain-containing protein n=1 Tax=Oceanivirga miroungae TaxID=1130046 RepID=A0A6I8MA83_9FUSO|nr:R3H domain-containing nucleic acid-binding protein [Oceanivirga miroungae]VWL85082.1 single-stranded nucleic acid binding R3H domain-containing protein [Oceanivirga miroungae]